MAYKINGKFVSKAVYDEYMANQSTDNTTEKEKNEMETKNPETETVESEQMFETPSYLKLLHNDNSTAETEELPEDIKLYENGTPFRNPEQLDAIDADLKELEELPESKLDELCNEQIADYDAENSVWYTEMRITIRELIDLCKSGKIVYAQYQRSPNAKAWKTDEHKTKLFKSIILGRPISTMEWRKRSDGKYECINGQQRITCIMQTVNDDYPFTALPPALDEYEEMRFSMLPDDVRAKFWNYTLQINLIDEIDDDAVIDYYTDLNRGAVPLTTIEARKGKLDRAMMLIPDIISNPLFVQTYKKDDSIVKIFGDKNDKVSETFKYDIIMKLAVDLYGDQSHDSGKMADWFINFSQRWTTDQTDEMMNKLNKLTSIYQSIARQDIAKKIFAKAKTKNNVSAILAVIDNNTQTQDAADNLAGFFTASKTCAKVVEYAKYSGSGSAKSENVKQRIRIMREIING